LARTVNAGTTITSYLVCQGLLPGVEITSPWSPDPAAFRLPIDLEGRWLMQERLKNEVMTIVFTIIAFLILKYALGLSYIMAVLLTPVAFLGIMLVLLALPPYGKFK
jgi:hypothetical protein